MLVTLIGDKKMQSLLLPSVVRGSYWITDKSESQENKLVNIEAVDGKWQIKSGTHTYIKTKNLFDYNENMDKIPYSYKVLSQIFLKEYSLHIISTSDKGDNYLLYCSPSFEKNFFKFQIKNGNFYVGRSDDCDLVYKNILLNEKQAFFNYENGNWYIDNKDYNIDIFVNSKIVEEKKMLKNGDIIFILGLKIIIIGNQIYVNNINNKVKFGENLVLDKSIEKGIGKLLPLEEDDDVKIYSEDEYFSRGPKINENIETALIKIDSPPAIQNQEEMPTILALGSSLSMSAIMMVSAYTAIEGIINGTATTQQSVTALISSGAMLTGMIMMPILTKRFQKNQRKKFEKKRQVKYRKYINQKIVTVNEIMDKQKQILDQNYPSTVECQRIIMEKSPRLWERKIDDLNFLSIRLGLGDLPLDIDLQYPGEKFRMDDDDLVSILNDIAQKSKILEQAPIALSLIEKRISAIIYNEKKNFNYIKNLILQTVALHNYTDLKLVFFVKEENYDKWNFVKMLPHVWDNSRNIRFFAKDDSDINDISKYLENDIEKRYSKGERVDYRSFSPYYLIITDDYKKFENVKIIQEILKVKRNLGFSLLCLTDDFTMLPNECQTFVNIKEENCKILESQNSSTTEKDFKLEENIDYDYSDISFVIANIPIRYNTIGNESLPKKYTFLEMYDVGRIEQLNIWDRWINNDTTKSLKAEIGSDGSIKPIVLDIHEKYHGPHGLIAGSTGSGKSEFIITYILSLAINYHPDDVNFVLIDYKGGGLAGAFQKKNCKLPHLVGTITNIDKNGLERSLSSIQSELKKRQILFNKAREMTDESTIDIYKYQKLYHDGVIKKPISHLFIICDEFAELKQQQPDFMDELISVARIGRSLGVHLILATQKPAGIVNEQIRSNSKFGICLKVQEKSDSIDVIKRPDAAYLKRTGQFYMNVGNDEYFILGQSAWTGAPYEPKDIVKKEIDTSIDFISDDGSIIKKYNNPKANSQTKSNGDQLTNIVQYICNLAKQENIYEEQLWLDEIPETIYLRSIKKKYNIQNNRNEINPVIGEYDDPSNQNQDIVRLNLSKDGNTLIFGGADSGKDMLISTLIFDLITTHSAEEVQIYPFDFGAETLKKFKDSPQVGDVIYLSDSEKIDRIFSIIEKDIKDRKNILSEYNGDYNFYIKNSNKIMPMKIYIINNYAVFSENYPIYEERLQSITRECTKCGIVFVLTINSFSEIKYRLAQNFKQKICLQLVKDDDYMYVFDKIGKKRPSKIKGRGLIEIDGGIYEFQTAQINSSDRANEYIEEIINKLNEISVLKAKEIPVIPGFVSFDDVKSALKGIESIPLGIATYNLKIASMNFSKNYINIISAKMQENAWEFTKNIIKEFKLLNNNNDVFFDMENILDEEFDFEKQINKIYNAIDRAEKNRNICIIVGIDKFMNKLGKEKFIELLKKSEKSYNFIISDSAAKIKTYQYEPWYKNYVIVDSGIWVGNGIDSQFLITTNASKKELVGDCGNSFGFYINQGKISMIKLLEMKEEENNE